MIKTESKHPAQVEGSGDLFPRSGPQGKGLPATADGARYRRGHVGIGRDDSLPPNHCYQLAGPLENSLLDSISRQRGGPFMHRVLPRSIAMAWLPSLILACSWLGATAALGQEISPVPAAETPATKSLLQTFHDGGPLMYPIAVCSFVLVIFICERIVSLRRGQVVPRPFVTRIFEQLREGQLDRESALALCEENGSPVALVLAGGFKKWGRTAVEVEQAVLDAGERVTNQLRKYLRLFNGISQVAPLLGLLGTVMGMISSFSAISASQETGQREMMAAGIAEALITTAAGMLVAIPALLAYLHFVSRVDQLVTEIDSHGQKLVELVSADGLERLAAARAPARKKAA